MRTNLLILMKHILAMLLQMDFISHGRICLHQFSGILGCLCEYFFEDSQGLKDNLPRFYAILCNTLNQDTLRPNETP